MVKVDRIPVGHAGNEISHRHFQRIVVETCPALHTELFGVDNEKVEELLDDPCRLKKFVIDRGRLVDMDRQPAAQFRDRLAHGFGQPDHAAPFDKRGFDQVFDHGIDSGGVCRTDDGADLCGDILLSDHPPAERIIQVVVHIGDDIGNSDDLPFQGFGQGLRDRLVQGNRSLGMPTDAVEYFDAEIESGAVFFQLFDNPQALGDMAKSSGNQSGENLFSGVPKRRVPEIVAESDRFDEVLVERQSPGDGTGDLRNFQRMGQAGPVVIPFRRQKDLGFIFEAPKRFAMQDTITINLVAGSQFAGRFSMSTTETHRTLAGISGQSIPLPPFRIDSNFHRILFRVSIEN